MPERPQGQAVVLLSDGIHNAGGLARVRESLAKAKASAAPIFTQTLGGTSGVKDLEVELNLPQELAFAAQQVPVTVNLRERGDLGPIGQGFARARRQKARRARRFAHAATARWKPRFR